MAQNFVERKMLRGEAAVSFFLPPCLLGTCHKDIFICTRGHLQFELCDGSLSRSSISVSTRRWSWSWKKSQDAGAGVRDLAVVKLLCQMLIKIKRHSLVQTQIPSGDR